jgi:hypothetical protein
VRAEGRTAPKVRLVCPSPLGRLRRFSEDFEGGETKSRQLAGYYGVVAETSACAFLDAGQYVGASDVDGVHLDADAHAALGRALAQTVREALDTPAKAREWPGADGS